MAALSLSVSALKTGQKTKEKNEILLTGGFQSHLFCLLEHKLESSIVLIGYDTIQNSILDGALQAADFPAWLQVEDFHNLGTIHRWLEITDAVFLLKVFQFLTHQLEVVEKTLFAHFIFEVMSASHSSIRSSMSSPASKSRRRTAESVTSSSAITIGRM